MALLLLLLLLFKAIACLLEEVVVVAEVWAAIGGDMGELCSGDWFPSESSLGREEGGVGGRPKLFVPLLPFVSEVLGSILMFSLGISRLLWWWWLLPSSR